MEKTESGAASAPNAESNHNPIVDGQNVTMSDLLNAGFRKEGNGSQRHNRKQTWKNGDQTLIWHEAGHVTYG
jgi:hypothetical protein